MPPSVPQLTSTPDLLLGFRFGVYFFALGKDPNELDIRFQKVSGLSASVKLTPLAEGGQNLYTQQLPAGIEYGRLVLERGRVLKSPLNVEIEDVLSLYKFATSNVIVTLFDETAKPLSAWLFAKAFPVKWATSNLDATQKNLLIDTIELAYSRMQLLKV